MLGLRSMRALSVVLSPDRSDRPARRHPHKYLSALAAHCARRRAADAPTLAPCAPPGALLGAACASRSRWCSVSQRAARRAAAALPLAPGGRAARSARRRALLRAICDSRSRTSQCSVGHGDDRVRARARRADRAQQGAHGRVEPALHREQVGAPKGAGCAAPRAAAAPTRRGAGVLLGAARGQARRLRRRPGRLGRRRRAAPLHRVRL